MARHKGRKKRQVKLRNQYVLVGDGETEKYYAQHIKAEWGLKYKIRPRLFGNNMFEAEGYIDEYLEAGANLIVYFMDYDTIVTQKDFLKYHRLKKKYKNTREVMICPSMPCIEYWFLLHFEYSTKRFAKAGDIKQYMRNHITDYSTTQNFLSNPEWVEKLHADNGLQTAIERAQKGLKATKLADNHHPFTYVHEGILSLLYGSPIGYQKYKKLQDGGKWPYW